MKIRFGFVTLCLLTLAACQNREMTITGGYGSGVVSGEAFVAGGSSEGMAVTVRETGMTATLGADGRFTFAGVPDGVTLRFVRPSDGIDATYGPIRASSHVMVEVSGKQASPSRRRSAPGAPMKQYEGLVRSATATRLVVFTSHQQEVEFVVTAQTVIRKGHEMMTAEELQAGDRVHVKATEKDGVKTAALIIVQRSDKDDDEDDRGGTTATANGHVKSLGTSEFVVLRANGDEKTVRVTATTIIKKYGKTIAFSEIKVGDKVEVRGTKVDASTITAIQIEVQDPHGRGK